jgi:hypothetical protein
MWDSLTGLQVLSYLLMQGVETLTFWQNYRRAIFDFIRDKKGRQGQTVATCHKAYAASRCRLVIYRPFAPRFG